ncbi:MAG: family 65 glycosyl hydrolase domain-containing protein, partial [Leadbetterella sp.]|nr:family 65 glycosyl hydrolase domain-containing protein [Leadbetterella sp.]
DYFAKVINSVNWIGIEVEVDGETIDLNTVKFLSFYRELHIKTGVFSKDITLELSDGKQLQISSQRFCSIHNYQVARINYEVKALNFSGRIALVSYLDGDVTNKDSNHDERFWNGVKTSGNGDQALLQVQTRPNPFQVPLFDVAAGMKNEVYHENTRLSSVFSEKDKYVALKYEAVVQPEENLKLRKSVVLVNSNDFSPEDLFSEAGKTLGSLNTESLLTDHVSAWSKAWENCDIVIEGDISAQIGIRFNIFHLLQTYNGTDSRLNIGPKGFTGEKYGGVTYWDTEAYCIPFYLASSDFSVARNLLVYRYNHLPKAIENAKKLGFKDGAALYPMVTMNGEECHNEWEITFEEIHRNGAIAYAIYDYINYTGDESYLAGYGLEVLIGIARFWSQRMNWSEAKQQYVMLGVTGPNEYENNVNNNWYTSYIATWTLKYTLEAFGKVNNLAAIFEKTGFREEEETARWKDILAKMYFPYDASREVFLQQDGFLDKELLTVDQIAEHRPINQKWSWDRILRSCFIKQADVLQGLYFFEDDFDEDTLRRNFDFYEPMTVHESSLSPCVHAILACRLGKTEKAYEMYLRTSRLDLDDYNNDTEDGLHITSMAGTWLAVIRGFAGIRIRDTELQIQPHLPGQWKSLTFRMGTASGLKEIYMDHEGYTVKEL